MTFPLAALPPTVRDLVEAVSESTQTPVALSGTLALAVLSAAGRCAWEVQVQGSFVEPLHLYCVAVADVGERKSPVFSQLVRPLHELDAERARAAEVEASTRAAQIDVLEVRYREALQAVKKAKTDTAREEAEDECVHVRTRLDEEKRRGPPGPFVVSDATPEALVVDMGLGDGFAGIFDDEPEVFESFLGRYSDKTGAKLGVYLKAHTRAQITESRVGRGRSVVERPGMAIGVTAQPGALDRLHDDRNVSGRGLLARFLWAWPPSLVGRREVDVPPLPPEPGQRWGQLVRRLARPPKAPQRLTLSPEAFYAHQELQERLEPRLGKGGDLAELHGWAHKLAGQVARIAGLLHRAEEAPGLVVGEGTMERAIELGEGYYLGQAQRVFDPERPGEAAVERLRPWLVANAGKTVTTRAIYRRHHRAFPTMRDLVPVLEDAVERRWILPVDERRNQYHITGYAPDTSL